jgi:hypothetical protein
MVLCQTRISCQTACCKLVGTACWWLSLVQRYVVIVSSVIVRMCGLYSQYQYCKAGN